MKKLFLLLLLAGLRAQADQITFDNSPEDAYVGAGAGFPDSGDLFVAPTLNVLDDWTFYLSNSSSTAQKVVFTLFDLGANPTFNSDGSFAPGQAVISISDGYLAANAAGAFTIFPDLTLNAGDTYLMSISDAAGLNLGLGSGGPDLLQLPETPDGLGLALVSNQTWYALYQGNPAYNAQFSDSGTATTVPDNGSTLALLGIVSLGMVCVRSKLGSPIIAQRS